MSADVWCIGLIQGANVKRGSFVKFFYWFLGSVVAIFAVLSLILSFLDWNQYRIPLAEFATNQTGMRVELAGDVSLALFPRPSVSAETVRLSPLTEAYSEVVATADRIAVRLGVLSLVKGRFSLQSLTLEGLDVTVEESEDGRWHVRGWPEESNASGPEIDLLRFSLKRSRSTIVPYQGDPIKVEGVSLDLEGTLPGGPLSWEGKFSTSGQLIKSSGRIRPVSVRDEVSVKADFSTAGSNLSLSGRILPSGNLTGRLELAGDKFGAFMNASSSIIQRNLIAAPNLPYRLDVQIDKEGDITRIVSRDLTISDTHGRLDLTVARKGLRHHVTGSVMMGVIDFDQWLAATDRGNVTVIPKTPLSAPKAVHKPGTTTGIGGAVDVNIEGFQVRNGLGQRIDAVVAFDNSIVTLSRISALLPGATNVAFTGKLGAEEGHGKWLIEAGNIADLVRWVGLKFSDSIPAGRLTTARLKADFDFSKGVWSLLNMDGQLDNTAFQGEMSGGLDATAPWLVRVHADAVNLDAYVKDLKLDGAFDFTTYQVPTGIDLTLDVTADNVNWLQQNFETVRVVGALAKGKMSVSQLTAKQGKARLGLVGTIENAVPKPILDMTWQAENWTMPVTQYFVPESTEIMRSLQLRHVTGVITAVGAMDALNVGVELKNGADSLALSGTMGLATSSLTMLDLQGNFIHKDLSGLLRHYEIADLKFLPVKTSVSLKKSTDKTPVSARLAGEVAGGTMTAELTLEPSLKGIHFTYNHENTGKLSRMIGIELPGFDYQSSLRSEIDVRGQDFPNDWVLSITNIRNGAVSVTGNVRKTISKQVSGVLNVSGIKMRATAGSSDKKDDSDPKKFFEALRGYGGNVQLALKDFEIAGQKLSAPAASVMFGDATARWSFGEGALLNSAPLTGTINLALNGDYTYEGAVTADKINVGAMLLAEGQKQILSADTKLVLTLNGTANSGNILRNMKASGTLEGQAGVLNFLSVPTLVSEIQNAQNGRSFLGKVGNLLRNGSTVIDSLEGKFALDNGVMLVETAKASGKWGALSLDGQLNFLDQFLTLKGELALLTPPDTPAIPVTYDGSFNNPTAKWSSRLFERFVLSLIERRVRTTLFQELEGKADDANKEGNNPGVAVFTRAFDLLNQLRKTQEDKPKQPKDSEKPEGES